jgi:hypothetical protein
LKIIVLAATNVQDGGCDVCKHGYTTPGDGELQNTSTDNFLPTKTGYLLSLTQYNDAISTAHIIKRGYFSQGGTQIAGV